MAWNNSVTLAGRLVADPELKTTQGGTSMCKFRMAVQKPKGRDGEEREASFVSVTCWRSLAENVAASLKKGQQVLVFGELEQRSWEAEGGRRSVVEVSARDVGPSLMWVEVSVLDVERHRAADDDPFV